MKLVAPISAARGWSARTRRNAYIAMPADATFAIAISVSAGARGRSSAIHVSGKSNALCGLAKNGLPANT